MAWLKTGNIRGPIGELGQPAYTLSTQDFTIPALGEIVEVEAENTDWVAIGEWLYIGISEEDCIALQVIAKTSTSITLLNAPSSVGIPGPPGPPGLDGMDGTDGADSTVPGPPGPSAVSLDADNAAVLGSDNLIFVPPSTGGLNYTLEEQDTGLLWIDGKKIYQKTVETGPMPTGGGNVYVLHYITNLNYYISISGVAYHSAGYWVMIPTPPIDTASQYLSLAPERAQIRINGSMTGYDSGYLTIRYTCTDR
jgi:hypothetical protein